MEQLAGGHRQADGENVSGQELDVYKRQLSTAIGKHNRKSVAILNAGFAKKLKEKLGVGEENGETK